MLERILSPSVAVASSRGAIAASELFPEEEAQVARAVEKRRLEFADGRTCARRALAQIGVAPAPILSGPRGEPRWPPGVVGSITHCEGYRACAVARDSDLLTLGVDAEPDLPLPGGLIVDVALVEERRRLGELARAAPGVSWDRLLFCAKESVYKAWFPLTGSWLGFEDARVELDPERGRFTARLLVPGPRLDGGMLEGFCGRWLAADGLLLTAIAVPAGGSDFELPGFAD